MGKLNFPEETAIPLYVLALSAVIGSSALSFDYKTFVIVDGSGTYVWDVPSGQYRFLSGVVGRFLSLSPDGRLLAVRLDRKSEPHPWLAWFVNWLGIKDDAFDMVLYDLTTETAVATMCDVDWAQFSPDGKVFAVIAHDTLSVYDFPLCPPWLEIATYAN